MSRFIGILIFVFTIGAIAPYSQKAFAHGVDVAYTTNTQTITMVEIYATYASGDPMSEAQVAVYAPDDPATPWQTGLCDQDGKYSFIPDAAKSGVWEVVVRQAGHGTTIYVPIEPEDHEVPQDQQSNTTMLNQATNASMVSSGYTSMQYVAMGASIIWGFVGTALYFSSRRKN